MWRVPCGCFGTLALVAIVTGISFSMNHIRELVALAVIVLLFVVLYKYMGGYNVRA